MLEICIIFCDKDFNNLNNLINGIKNKIKIPYIIKAWDNRQDNKEDLEQFENVTYYNIGGGNIRQFKARQKLAEYVDDDNYVWFVDGDDDIMEIESFPDVSNDLLIFSFLFNKKVYHTFEWNEKDIMGLNAMLWNKWIKGSLLKKAVKQIPQELDVTASEDQIISLLSFINNDRSYQVVDKVIYDYNNEVSNCFCIDYSNNYDKLEACTRGVKEAKEFIKTLISEDEYNNFLICSYHFFIFEKLLETENEEVAFKMIQKIHSFYTQEERDYMFYNAGLNDKDKKNFVRVVATLQPTQKYRKVRYTYEDGSVVEEDEPMYPELLVMK